MSWARAGAIAVAGALAFGVLAYGSSRRVPAGSQAMPPPAPRKPTRFDGVVVRSTHPRIWLDPERVAFLRAKANGKSTADVVELAGRTAPGFALAAIATGDPKPCRDAFAKRDAPAPLHHVALLYDWCHDELSADERKILRDRLVAEMQAEMKNGRLWRSFHNAGHTASFWLMLAALAVHGDDPIGQRALEFLEPELEDMMHVFDELFPDGEWAESVDYARHASHHALRTLLALKTATGRDFLAASPHLRNIADYIFYVTKPNGLVYNGDDDDYPFLSGWERMALLMIVNEFRDPHAQWFLAHARAEKFVLPERDRFHELLWADPSVPERSLDDLPLARIFRGKGLVIARTSWDLADRSAAWLAFTNGPWFGDHSHLDVNAFQIHRGGDLAIDSGRYDDDWDFSRKPHKLVQSQFFNYYQRTIAHNTMLVRDPSESFGPGLVNDGGQRWMLSKNGHRNSPEDWAQGTFPSDDGRATCDWTKNPGRWDRGRITAYRAEPDFVFVRGDGAAAYAAAKVPAFVRELVFVHPRIVIVFDRIVSTNPEFEKTWLLHTIDEPRVAPDGSWLEVTEGEGRLFGVAALPADRKLAKVGGPGNEFLVDGHHYAAGPRSALHPTELHYGERPGAWRIEEKPGEPRASDVFANVMLLTDRASTDRPRVVVLADHDATVVLRVEDEGETRVDLTFAKAGPPATSLRIERRGTLAFDAKLANEVVLERGRQ